MSFFLLFIMTLVGSYGLSGSLFVNGRIPLRFCLCICNNRYCYRFFINLFEYGVPLNMADEAIKTFKLNLDY